MSEPLDISARAREWLREVFGKYDKTTDLVSMRLSDLLTEVATAARMEEREACAEMLVQMAGNSLPLRAGIKASMAIRDREPQ